MGVQPDAMRGSDARSPGRLFASGLNVLTVLPMLATLAFSAALSGATGASAQSLPNIRLSASNQVPACVTPDRLMAFLKQRNRRLAPRFADIAHWYQHHGELWRVRWDYAFFQMALETNFLTYRTGSGKMGDVNPRQNNFAGLGTTGGGVPGDSFPDVSTGVLGQIQHLVAYSGERLSEPAAPRTALKQDHIIALSLKLGRPVTFGDLARRWAVDPNYGRSIQWVARQFTSRYCRGEPTRNADSGNTDRPAAASPRERVAGGQLPVRTIWRRDESSLADGRGAASLQALRTPEITAFNWPAPNRLGAGGASCRIGEASYGGRKAILLRRADASGVQLTVLGVMAGFEASMVKAFQDYRAPGAEVLGTFDDKQAALEQAELLCSMTAPPRLTRESQHTAALP